MNGRASQRKGREAEIELSHIFQGYGIPAEPGSAMNFGAEPDIKGVSGLHCEVKRRERWSLPEWTAQAERDAAAMGDGAPAVIFRSNRQPWRICMRLDDFMEFYRKAQAKGGPP